MVVERIIGIFGRRVETSQEALNMEVDFNLVCQPLKNSLPKIWQNIQKEAGPPPGKRGTFRLIEHEGGNYARVWDMKFENGVIYEIHFVRTLLSQLRHGKAEPLATTNFFFNEEGNLKEISTDRITDNMKLLLSKTDTITETLNNLDLAKATTKRIEFKIVFSGKPGLVGTRLEFSGLINRGRRIIPLEEICYKTRLMSDGKFKGSIVPSIWSSEICEIDIPALTNEIINDCFGESI